MNFKIKYRNYKNSSPILYRENVIYDDKAKKKKAY